MFKSSASERRAGQRDRLIVCAEAAIAEGGLAALRARSLADCVGCSVGAIYNLVEDLDELALLVGQRTMAEINGRLDAVKRDPSEEADPFVGWALAYCAFAVANRNRWRALFELRLPPDKAQPDWFTKDQMRLFERLEEALARRIPNLDLQSRRLRARTLFSAVHGIVTLGIEEKIAEMPIAHLETELAMFVRQYIAGIRT